jgi:hypothetical protein
MRVEEFLDSLIFGLQFLLEVVLQGFEFAFAHLLKMRVKQLLNS